MRSSTSSSEASRRKWVRVWVLTGCLVAIVIGGWELALRAAGLSPEYIDNRALWLSTRHQLSRPDDNVVAILGASRIQRAVNVDVLRETLGRPVVQLAIEGSSGLPVLENLAADPRFRGTVIFSIAPPFSFNGRLSKLDAGNQADWMRAYVDQSRSRRTEQELRLDLQELFAFRAADASVSRTIPFIFESGRFPGPDFKTTFRNRFVRIDLSQFERAASPEGVVEMYRENSVAYEPQGFSELLDYFGALVDFLNAKGSRVFVLRLPTEGAVLDYERQTFPKDRFWSQMEQRLAARFIHFDDYPQLEGYLSADGSHIASEKAAEFTAQLATVLAANGL